MAIMAIYAITAHTMIIFSIYLYSHNKGIRKSINQKGYSGSLQQLYNAIIKHKVNAGLSPIQKKGSR
jgi:hypothetical protein